MSLGIKTSYRGEKSLVYEHSLIEIKIKRLFHRWEEVPAS